MTDEINNGNLLSHLSAPKQTHAQTRMHHFTNYLHYWNITPLTCKCEILIPCQIIINKMNCVR